MGVGLWWGLVRAGPSTTWTKTFCWKFGRAFFSGCVGLIRGTFSMSKDLFQTLIWNRCFLLWTLVFVQSGVDITRAVMVWICLYMFFGNESGSLCHPQIFQEDGHFHLPHLPNSSKNHHEISWDHTITSWWFQTFFIFTPIWGNDPIWRSYFSGGLVQPPTRNHINMQFGVFQDSGAKKELTPKHTREPVHKSWD